MKELFTIISISILFISTITISIKTPQNKLAPLNNSYNSFFSDSILHHNYLQNFVKIWEWYTNWANIATIKEEEKEGIIITTYDRNGNKDSTFKIEGYQVVTEGNMTVIKIKK